MTGQGENTKRATNAREVDFLITKDNHPKLMLEVKSTARALSPGLRYFQEKYRINGVQLVADLRLEDHSQPLRLVRLYDFLRTLGT